MSNKKQTLIAHNMLYYHALLLRYARRLLQNKQLAGPVVTEVLESLHEQNDLLNKPQLRFILKMATARLCQSVNLFIAGAEEVLEEASGQSKNSQIKIQHF